MKLWWEAYQIPQFAICAKLLVFDLIGLNVHLWFWKVWPLLRPAFMHRQELKELRRKRKRLKWAALATSLAISEMAYAARLNMYRALDDDEF